MPGRAGSIYSPAGPSLALGGLGSEDAHCSKLQPLCCNLGERNEYLFGTSQALGNDIQRAGSCAEQSASFSLQQRSPASVAPEAGVFLWECDS